MKRCLVLATALSLVLTWLFAVAEVAARSGGGGFRSGNRATREEDHGVRSAPGSDTGQSQVPDAPAAKPPKKSKSWRGMVRGLLTGGLIGGIFFGRGFGGVGLLEVVLLSGLIAVAFWALSRYQAEPTGHYAHAGAYGGGLRVLTSSGPDPTAAGAGRDVNAPDLVDLRQADPAWNAADAAEAVGDVFRRVQAAWTERDVSRVADVLTVEMREQLDRECARLRASRRINRVERITLRRVAVAEAWQAGGWDRIKVQIDATLIDYTTDEVGLKVLEGNPFDPVPFREQWELVRPSGAHPWRVSAIQ